MKEFKYTPWWETVFMTLWVVWSMYHLSLDIISTIYLFGGWNITEDQCTKLIIGHKDNGDNTHGELLYINHRKIKYVDGACYAIKDYANNGTDILRITTNEYKKMEKEVKTYRIINN